MLTLLILLVGIEALLLLTWLIERPIPTEPTADRSRGVLPPDWRP